MISQLHYISQAETPDEHLDVIEQACKAGCNWIQLRIKNEPVKIVQSIAEKALAICRNHGATFILNDYVKIAKEVGADGVHVGKTDMDPSTVRALLGEGKIIGGTANTWEDVERLNRERVDYMGLGPFRFTSTKQNLSPILGLEGYKNMIERCKQNGISIPIIAIGGIRVEDVAALKKTGVHGVAVSGAITHSPHMEETIKTFYEALA